MGALNLWLVFPEIWLKRLRLFHARPTELTRERIPLVSNGWPNAPKPLWTKHLQRLFASPPLSKECSIAKNKNTFEKRKREMEKKAKAEAKRARRLKRKQADEAGNPQDGPPVPPHQPQAMD